MAGYLGCKKRLCSYERLYQADVYKRQEASLEQSCIAGPFHPAFGEMVYSRVWRKCLLDMLDQGDCREKVLEIFVRPQMLSKAVGQKRENIRWLADKGYEAVSYTHLGS